MAKTTMLDLLNGNNANKMEQLEKAEQITQQIKNQTATTTLPPTPEETKRISVDCPMSMYLAANTLRILRKKSLKDYILALMAEDIEKAKKEKII